MPLRPTRVDGRHAIASVPLFAAVLLTGCASVIAASDASLEDRLDVVSDLPGEGGPDAMVEAAIDGAAEDMTAVDAQPCDQPLGDSGEVGVVCREGIVASMRTTLCPRAQLCCARGAHGICEPNFPGSCEFPSVAGSLRCDGREDCPSGEVCCYRAGSHCLPRAECPIQKDLTHMLCHEDADCPCDVPRCCGRVYFPDPIVDALLRSCSTECDGG